MSWVEEELVDLDLDDRRLNNRCRKFLDSLSQSPQRSIPSACKSWNETISAYRLLSNKKITSAKLLQPHINSMKQRAREEKILLCLQDTTEIDYSSHSAKKGIGPLNSEKHRGLLLHPTLVTTPEQLCLGILDDYSWYREDLEKKRKHKTRPLEEKESYRWLQSYRKTQLLAKEFPESTVINIGDRESDIFEIFLEHQETQGNIRCEYIVRATQNRSLVQEEDETVGKLWEYVEKSPNLGQIEFDTPAGRGKKSRHVVQSLQATQVTLQCPQSRRPRVELPAVKVTAVLAKEIDPPAGEEPVTWLLLTSIPVENFELAQQIIKYYLCRWCIERFFMVLKQGCKIEELHFQNEKTLNICLRFYMIVAWRILYLTMLGRIVPEISCDVVFEEYEWKAVYVFVKRQPPPRDPPSLDTMIRMIAGLGGFLNRKGDGFPGVKTMWIGLQRTLDITSAWIAFNQTKFEHTYV
jgi:Transposase Tn5 dimerisation domain/Transposase DNA-binding